MRVIHLGKGLVALFTIGAALGANSEAATVDWTGSTSTAWATGGNWVGASAPANDITTDIARFDLTSYTNQPQISGSRSIAGLQFGDGTTATAALTLSGASTPILTIGTSGITVSANAGTATISAPVRLGGSQSWTNNSSSLLTVSGTVSNTADVSPFTLSIGGSGSGGVTISGIISDGGTTGTTAVSVNTAATTVTSLTSSSNSFTGGVTLSGGILRASGSNAATSNALGQGTLTLAGGELQLVRAATGNGVFGRNTTVTGNAKVTSEANTANAGVTHSLGTLNIGANTLTVAAGSTVATGTSAVTFGATTFTGNSNFTVNNNISGVATNLNLGALADNGTGWSVSKAGTGTLTLTAAAGSLTSGGSLTVTEGSLVTSVAGALGNYGLVLAGGANNTVWQMSSGTNSNAVSISSGSGTRTMIWGTGIGNATMGSVVTLDNDLTITDQSTLTNSTQSIAGTIAGTGNLYIRAEGSRALTLNSVLSFNGDIHTSKTGSSTLTLAADNTSSSYAGTVYVDEGTVNMSLPFFNANIAAGVSSGATLALPHSDGMIMAGLKDGVGGGGTITSVAGNTDDLTLAGSGTYSYSGILGTSTNLVVIKSGTGTQTLSGANGFGNLTVEGGTLIAGADALSGAASSLGNATSAIALGSTVTTSNNYSASLMTGGAVNVARAITVANQATTGTYTIGGNSDNNSTFSGLITTNQNLTLSQVATSGSNRLSITGGITGASATAKTLNFSGPGTIEVSTTGISNGTGTIAVNVAGGTTILSAANTYTGATTVSGGTLLVNGSLASGSAVDVAAGAKLGGSGTIGGAVTMNGSVTPGNSIGTLTINNDLIWNASSGNEWKFELGVASGSSDLLALAGAGSDFLKGTGSNFQFDFLGTGVAGTFVLVDWAGTTTFSGTDFSYTGLAGGLTGSFAISGNQLQFSAVAVPEPSTVALLAGGLALLFRLRRRRAKS